MHIRDTIQQKHFVYMYNLPFGLCLSSDLPEERVLGRDNPWSWYRVFALRNNFVKRLTHTVTAVPQTVGNRVNQNNEIDENHVKNTRLI